MQYIYGSSRFSDFLICPRSVLNRKDLSDGTKILYIYLLARARMSMKKACWQDQQGRIFLSYSVRDLGRILDKGDTAVKRSLKQLEDACCILRVYRGIGRAAYIYVMVPSSGDDRKEPVRQSEKGLPESPKRDCQRGRNGTAYYIDRNNINNNLNNKKYSYEEGESL